MKIVFLAVRSLSINASIKRAIGLGPRLAAAGWSVHFLVEDLTENRGLAARMPEIAFSFYTPGSFLSERRQKKAIIRELNPDILFSCGLGFRNIPTWRRPEGRLLIIDHGELESFKGRGPKAVLMGGLEWFSLCFADGHVLASRYLEFLFRHRLFVLKKKRPLLHLPYGADAMLADPAATHGLPETFSGKKVVLYFGSLAENYGCFDMLAAASLAVARREDLVFVFCGKGPDHAAFRARAEADPHAGRLLTLGYVDDSRLARLVEIAAVHLCPLNDTLADWARCPSKIYMQMLGRVPIVTCRIGEAPDALDNDGIYYDPGDVRGMCGAVLTAADKAEKIDYDLHEISWENRTAVFGEWVGRSFRR